MSLRVYTNKKLTEISLIPVVHVVVAESAIAAATMLNEKLIDMGYKGDLKFTDMREVKNDHKQIITLSDGDY